MPLGSPERVHWAVRFLAGRSCAAWRAGAALAAALTATGCRIGFDLTGGSGADGAAGDGRPSPADASRSPDATPLVAPAAEVTGFTPTTGPGALVGLVAIGMAEGGADDGWATAFLGPGASVLWGARFSSTFTPATAAPHHTTPSDDQGYTEVSLAWDGAHVVAALNRPIDGGTYLKVLSNAMDGFPYIVLAGNERPALPAFARAGARMFGLTYQGDIATARFLDPSTGQHDTAQPSLALPPAGATIVAASTGAAAGAGLVAAELADGSCLLAAVFSTASVTTARIAPPCAAPAVAALGGTWDGNQAVVVYRTGGEVLARWLRVDGANQALVLSSTVVALTSTLGPVRLVETDQLAALWLDGDALRGAVIPVDPSAPLTPLVVSGLPAAAPSAWTAAALGPTRAVLATYGDALWTATW